MINRVILHSDLNNFFASVETMLHPEFENAPLAVCGDPTLRHGIVLAKNESAKKMGVKTGMTIRESQKLCPNLIVTAPHPEEYEKISRRVRAIYKQYTNQVEPFGIDEAWLDVTHSTHFGTGVEIANRLRQEIKEKIGITASVGVSFNKCFAKLGSDYKKPDATTEITKHNFRQFIWPLSVSDLLFVGKSAVEKLKKYNVFTIGDLAKTDESFLQSKFGKMGSVLFEYANGYDNSPVVSEGQEDSIKSIGNSITTYRDMLNEEDAKIPVYSLCDSVSARLQESELGKATTVQLFVRDAYLRSYTRQCKIQPSNLSTDFAKAIFALMRKHDVFSSPLRAIGVSVRDFTLEGEQVDFLSFQSNRKKEELQKVIFELKDRYGKGVIDRAVVYSDVKMMKNREHSFPEGDMEE